MAADAGRSKTAFIAEGATVRGDVSLGDQVSIWFGAVVRADRDRITIGDRSNVQDNAVLHTSAGHPLLIGEDVSVGHGAILHGCTIADRVLVGMGAVVLNGARIGRGSIVGAGAVVTEGMEVPPGSVVVGIPGKIIKETSAEQKNHIVENARNYWNLARSYLHG